MIGNEDTRIEVDNYAFSSDNKTNNNNKKVRLSLTLPQAANKKVV